MVRQSEAGALASDYEEFEKDPGFIAELLAIRVTEDAARLMSANSLSRAALALRMGTSAAYVSKLMNAPPNLTLHSIARIAAALNAHVSIGLSTDEGGAARFVPGSHQTDNDASDSVTPVETPNSVSASEPDSWFPPSKTSASAPLLRSRGTIDGLIGLRTAK